MIFFTNSAKDTKNLASSIPRKFPDIKYICLFGDFGAGKTTFAQGIGNYFKLFYLPSPTFTYIRHYITQDKKIKKLVHADLYRLYSYHELLLLGFEEIVKESQTLVVIEWADRIKEHLPRPRLEIYLSYISAEKRKIILKEIPHQVGDDKGRYAV